MQDGLTTSRREFLKVAATFTGGTALGALATPALAGPQQRLPSVSAADLPKGSAPKPVRFPHFPDSLHGFV